MQRVLVIGCGGAGKTTLAVSLHRATGLPLIHLDELYWRPRWEATPAEEWEARVDELIARPRWIMDGNYGGTLDRRLEAADTVIFLDMPRLVCMRRLLQRRLRYHHRSRPSLPADCPERLSLEFLWWVWTYPERRRPGILEKLSGLGPGTRVEILRGERDVKRFLGGIHPALDEGGAG